MKQNIYSECATIHLGCKMYLDESGETLAPAGKYSNGATCYTLDSFGTVTALNACGETTTTSTSTTSTTSTSTSTTTTTIAPGSIGVNYLINLPANGTYNYSFTPFSSSVAPSTAYSTNPSVNCVINDFTRYVFSESCSFSTSNLPASASVPPIQFNAVSGTLIYDIGLAPYITASNLVSNSWLCSGFAVSGTGSILATSQQDCSGTAGPGTISMNSTYAARVNSFTLTSGSIANSESTLNGYRVPNPLPTTVGGQYNNNGQVYECYWITINTPGYATQSMWLPNGSYSSLNGVPIISGSKITYFTTNPGFGGYHNLIGFGGNKTIPATTYNYQYLTMHTFTSSGEFAYRFQNQF
jgi:hypothetical protein